MTKIEGILPDMVIEQLSITGMITPYVSREQYLEDTVAHKAISYGVSSFGYDVRLANVFKIANTLPHVGNGIIDPKEVDDHHFTTIMSDEPILIPPHGFVLGHTVESFDIPDDVMCLCYGKSTYARAGISVSITPIEPGFKGTVVIEIFNQFPLPVKLYPNEGIAQFVFHRAEVAPNVTYASRSGKYQGQEGIVHGKV